MANKCGLCKNFMGGGDIGLCCTIRDDLRYSYSDACDSYDEDLELLEAIIASIMEVCNV